jgi:hypothetical protein
MFHTRQQIVGIFGRIDSRGGKKTTSFGFSKYNFFHNYERNVQICAAVFLL